MGKYPHIVHALRTIFNVEDGLSEDVSIRLYQRSILDGENTEAVKAELRLAFDDSDSIVWKEMLCNPEFEVYDADSDEDAKSFALRILWNPIFGE